jgi:hypothetical protein
MWFPRFSGLNGCQLNLRPEEGRFPVDMCSSYLGMFLLVALWLIFYLFSLLVLAMRTG